VSSLRSSKRLLALKLAGVLALCVLAYAGWALRACGEQTDVPLGGVVYELCGRGADLVASAPVDQPLGVVLYSWREVDGNKPGIQRLRYLSHSPVNRLHEQMTRFLTSLKFQREQTDAPEHSGYEVWRKDYMTVDLALRPDLSRNATEVEIDHSSGLD
jgi:hypothetical protein